MTHQHGPLAGIAGAPGVDAREMEERKCFFGLDEADLEPLAFIHRHLDAVLGPIGEAFYAHLLRFATVRALLPDEAALARLKAAQQAYFKTLTAGHYGQQYIADRLRVGAVHQRIGLAPQWYIGAYRLYLTQLLPHLQAWYGADTAGFERASAALLKVVFLDMSLAIDAYMHAEQQEILSLKNYAEQIIHSMPCGLLVIDNSGEIHTMNRAAAELFGLPEPDRARAACLTALVPSQALQDCIAATIASQRPQSELVVLDTGGRARHLQCTISPTVLENRPLLLLIAEDVSRHKSIEQDLLYLATHDTLTGLPNRILLRDRLTQACAAAERLGHGVAVMFIDLDRFKYINDSLGHDAGDKVLIECARRLAARLRDGDTVARLGGDEFVVVLADLLRAEDAASVARQLLATLREPMEVLGQEVAIAGSIGISLYPKDGSDSDALLMNADAAMYQAKDVGRGNFQFYAGEMNALTLDRLRIESGLRHALARGEFLLHYQPQLDIASGRIIGFEALLRWQPPGKPMVPPSYLIPIAEESGLIVPIGEWVLHTACAQQRRWQELGFGPLRVAVNLSARQFQQTDLVDMVAAILRTTGCRPSCLELELTESMTMKNPAAATATLRRLSDMGVQLSIDDFGTGYSSLNHLKRFPIHALKIDQSFVRDITTDAHDASIAKAVIALGHSMQLTVLAEGVETVEQLDFLRQHGCDQMQGYYASRPLPAADIEALLARHVTDARPLCGMAH